MALVAGVDSSTSACKVQVRDADTGELVGSGSAPHPATTPPRSEQHPDGWWAAFELAAGRAGVFDRNRPAAIAVAAQQHGLVVSDATGVLRPAKLWNDTESATDAAELVATLGPAAWAAACGSVPGASFTIAKLRWLRREEPETFARATQVSLPHDWLTGRLTGAHVTDRGDASGTGWWSPTEGCYRSDLLALVDDGAAWDELLPRVLGPTEPAGLWDGVVVGPGTGDNMAGALGLGLVPGDLTFSLGTSGTAFCVSERPTADPGGAVAGFADATGRFLPLVCTLNATKVTDAFARLLGVDAQALDDLADLAGTTVGGPVLVPHLDGERTPERPGATGTLSGIRSDVTREQLAHAAFEGVICNLLAGAEHLPSQDGRTFLIGGGARSRTYRQLLADLSGRPVLVPAETELVAVGAAIQAAAVLSGTDLGAIADAWGTARGNTIEPRPGLDPASVRDAYAAAVAAASGDLR